MLTIESSVGWSKSIVGDNSSLDLVARICTNSVAAIESKPADINGTLVSMEVPRVSYTTDPTIALESPRALN